MSDLCNYPMCNCPFDMDGSEMCLRGFPRKKNEQNIKLGAGDKNLKDCDKCLEKMVAILNPTAGVTPWPLSCWYCAACGNATDPVSGECVPVVQEAELIGTGSRKQELALAEAPPECPFCADDDAVYFQLMSPIYSKKPAGLWCLSHWYCPECLRLDVVSNKPLQEVAA